MPALINRYNDGSSNPPRLRLSHSLWSLTKLPMNGEDWSLQEKCRRVREAGFEAIECWLTDENEAEITGALRAEGLRLALGHHPHTLDDTRKTVARAKRLGADYVFAQPANADTPAEDALALVRDGHAYASEQGVPYFMETHRNCCTETLPHTYRLLERMPQVRITADLSHFFVVGEFYGWESERLPEQARAGAGAGFQLPRPHLQRRAGAGGCGRRHRPAPQVYVQIWAQGMRGWLRGARPGDVLPFASELGSARLCDR